MIAIATAPPTAVDWDADTRLERIARADHLYARLLAHRALCDLCWEAHLAVLTFEVMQDERFAALCVSYVRLLAEHQRIVHPRRVPADPRD